MNFAFEVRESDLLGRIGTISVGGKKLETPCLFPVVHPVKQAIGVDELEEMGFGGLMTNSYIVHKRRKEEAIQKGIHGLLGFDGVLMTDSGGYQVLEYGDLDVDYNEIADFQSRVGSDLAVTLDKPTGFSYSRRYSEETADYSLKNATATIKEFGGSRTTWVGPVQGGLFPDLLRKSAKELIKTGFEFLALGSPVQVMENYRYSELVKMIVATRKAIPYSMPLHLFGAGHPHTMALAVALGCDTFDSASYILFARDGRYMTERGATRLSDMKYLPCSCSVCSRTTVRELLQLDAEERTRRLAIHNLLLLRKEVEACKEAISEGRLWDLVQERAAGHPSVYEAFVESAKHPEMLRQGTPAFKEKGLLLRGEMDLGRPEVALASSRLDGALRKDSKNALLLSSGEPLTSGKLLSGGPPARATGWDLYRLHPVLGPCPTELDFVYPFTQTVSAAQEFGKEAANQAIKKLRGLGYSHILLEKTGPRGKLSGRKSRGAPPSLRAASPRA